MKRTSCINSLFYHFVAVIICFSSVSTFSENRSFFCIGDESDCISKFENEWFSGHLIKMKESSIFSLDSIPYQIYRFIWLRTFHHPYCIIVKIKPDATGLLIAKMADGAGGYDPGKLVRCDTIIFNKQEINNFLLDLSNLDFWSIPTNGGNDGLDGAEWLLEGKSGNKYHFIKRWSPQSGKYHDFCLKLLNLAKVVEKEIY